MFCICFPIHSLHSHSLSISPLSLVFYKYYYHPILHFLLLFSFHPSIQPSNRKITMYVVDYMEQTKPKSWAMDHHHFGTRLLLFCLLYSTTTSPRCFPLHKMYSCSRRRLNSAEMMLLCCLYEAFSLVILASLYLFLFLPFATLPPSTHSWQRWWWGLMKNNNNKTSTL